MEDKLFNNLMDIISKSIYSYKTGKGNRALDYSAKRFAKQYLNEEQRKELFELLEINNNHFEDKVNSAEPIINISNKEKGV